MKKLHLGCGRKYLEGYINIDCPVMNQTVQTDLFADEYVDITVLKYEDNSIDEIRLHHVFEHFSRPVALALLCRWRNWLKPGGLLRIETPDANACFRMMLSPFTSFECKQQVMRHLFGSHEASWAFHADGWYEGKFRIVLNKLGFTKIKSLKSKWELLRNIEIEAIKSNDSFKFVDFEKATKEILRMSAIKLKKNNNVIIPESETEMINVWIDTWKAIYEV